MSGNIAPTPQRGTLLESIEVDGVGAIELPLSTEDCLKLVDVCEQAPYGHGLATVVNTNVRRAWQVDASKVTFPCAPQFLTQTIQLLANDSVRALGLYGGALQLEAHFYKLLLYEAGGHFSLHRDTEKEPGMFGTLVLQLPTHGGFEGGALVVRHSREMKTFDFSKDSSTGCFYTVFFADCEHELRTVTSGMRLCLAFNLVRGNNSFGMQLDELKGFSSKLAELKAALRPWLEAVTAEELQGQLDQNLPSKLAIPLQHKYTKTNLSFVALKGEDRIIAEVLKCCGDLELHLCILTRYQTGQASHDGYDGYRHQRQYDDDDDDDNDPTKVLVPRTTKDPDNKYSMEEVFDESFETTNWIGIDNKICSFMIDIDQDTEVVFDEDKEKDPFDDDDAKPDEVEYEGNTGNAGPTLEYWYHKAMIVIWPKKKTVSIICKLGLSALLDFLESRLAKQDPDFVTLLHQTLTYCKRNSGMMSSQFQFPGRLPLTCDGKPELVLGRLLELSLGGGALEDVSRVLRLLLEPFHYEERFASKRAVMPSVGIGSANIATTIAKAVRIHGWDTCGTDVMGFLKQDHVALQGKFFGQLALELQKLGCYEVALLVAEKTLELACAVHSSLGQLEAELVCTMAKLIFSFKECLEKLGLRFVKRFCVEVDSDVLCSLVIQVHAKLPRRVILQESSTEDGVSGASLFRRLCEKVTTSCFHRSIASQGYVVELVEVFYSLGNEQLFDKLIQAFVDQSRLYKQQRLLKMLLEGDRIWQKLAGTAIFQLGLQSLSKARIGIAMGQQGLQSLSKARIEELAAKKAPVFSWCMPLAKFPRHPAVEAFLKGSQERITYTGVNDLPHARNFARKYFRGSYEDGYSGIGQEGGRGAGAYCVISKTRAAFQQLVLSWEKEQEELRYLQTRLGNLQTIATKRSVSDQNKDQNKVVILSPDASPQRDKRRKIGSTEYIDSSVDAE